MIGGLRHRLTQKRLHHGCVHVAHRQSRHLLRARAQPCRKRLGAQDVLHELAAARRGARARQKQLQLLIRRLEHRQAVHGVDPEHGVAACAQAARQVRILVARHVEVLKQDHAWLGARREVDGRQDEVVVPLRVRHQ